MAGGTERILRGRVKAMQSTKKITRAMELIAGSRIVKAQQRVQAAVPYSEQITEVVKDLAAAGASFDSPMLAGRDEIKTTCYVAITEGYFRFRDYQLSQSFMGFSDQPTYEDARRIGEYVVDLFVSGKVDKVELVYTRFITAGSQEVVLRPLVPLSAATVAGGDGKAGSTDGSGSSYEFEPDPTEILDTLLPRYVEARIYAALLNAAASEHAFRQRAMKSATDNAEDLIKSLSIVMNRARQASITSEIMEIVGGAAALDGGDNIGGYVDMGDDFFGAQLGAPSAPSTRSASPATAAPAAAATVPDSGTATATIERPVNSVDGDEDLTPGDTKS